LAQASLIVHPADCGAACLARRAMGGGKDLQKLSAQENLALGVLAGCGTKCMNYPLLTSKNYVQQGLPLSMNPRVFYRGLPMAMVNFGGTCGVQFWFTGTFQKLLNGGTGRALTGREQMTAAFLGGLCSGIPCSFWELTMIQQQRFGGSLFSTPQRLVRDHGVASLVRGMLPCMARESLFTTAMLGGCPVIQRELMERFSLSEPTALAAGALSASLVSGALTHPADSVKTCMQGDVGGITYTNVLGTGRVLAQQHGIAQGLFRGFGFRIALISTSFFLVNKWKATIAPVMFPDVAPVPAPVPVSVRKEDPVAPAEELVGALISQRVATEVMMPLVEAKRTLTELQRLGTTSAPYA